jgi:hypothetical protein
MLRRTLTAVLASAAVLALAGCVGLDSADGREAQQLLEQAEQAQAELRSMTFQMRVKGEAAGQSFTMKLGGGGYLKGKRAGDFAFEGSMEAPGLPATEFKMVMQGGRMWMGLGGQWQELPVPQGTTGADAALESQLANLDFSRFVTDVSVENDTTFLGEPVTKIVGVIDTAGLVESFVGELGSLGGSFGTGLPSDFTEHLGDTRVIVYVSDETDVVRAARITMSIEYEGETMNLEVDYALTGMNEPVEIPAPPTA